MKLSRLEIAFLHQLPDSKALKGACLLLPGALHALPETAELPAGLAAALPAVILCRSCDAYAERLLNERGVAIAKPVDSLDALPEGAEVEILLADGELIDVATGRRHELEPLHEALARELRSHV